MSNFCPLCETVHPKGDPCSIRGLALVKATKIRPEISAQVEKLILGEPTWDDITSGPTKAPKPSKAELKAIIAKLENEKKDRRARKAASQKRWRAKIRGANQGAVYERKDNDA